MGVLTSMSSRKQRYDLDMRTFQTHIHKDLLKRIRIYSIAHEIPMEKFAAEAFELRLARGEKEQAK